MEIPVSNVKPGTVAVLVHPDGTEELMKDSIPTEGGIRLTVNGGAMVKIIDNSKDFIDTRAHWAKDKGASDGANPNAAINRAQMVTMLWRAMGQPAAASGASFADVPADSYYAQAVAWAIENGITAGVGNGKFDPDAACTRGQIATFLYRYMK